MMLATMPFLSEHPDAPGWKFTITEVSNNVYRIDGRNASARSISRTSHLVDELMRDCIQDALEVSRQPPDKSTLAPKAVARPTCSKSGGSNMPPS